MHKVREQVNGPHNVPFAQRLALGGLIVGEVCLGSVHKPTVNTFKTTVLDNGRSSFFQPCTSLLRIKEKIHHAERPRERTSETTNKIKGEILGQAVFNHTEHDNKLAHSIEDDIFF